MLDGVVYHTELDISEANGGAGRVFLFRDGGRVLWVSGMGVAKEKPRTDEVLGVWPRHCPV